MRGTLPLLLTTVPILVAAPPVDSTYVAGIEAWRADRSRRLQAEDGWLTLVGLHFLSEGENPVGADPKDAVALPEGCVPRQAGAFILEKGTVRLHATVDSGITLDGKPVPDAPLRTDQDGKPDLLRAGRISFHVIRRGDRFAIRVKDPEAAARRTFKGIPAYPVDPAWRVEGSFEAYPAPKEIGIPTVLGTVEKMPSPGLVHFTVKGRKLALQPVQEGEELFFIFADATSGKGTYPAGRFLYAAAPKDGKVVLDFNKAYNPPCAFSPYATCPLPPAQNRLKLAIPAGEKDYGHH